MRAKIHKISEPHKLDNRDSLDKNNQNLKKLLCIRKKHIYLRRKQKYQAITRWRNEYHETRVRRL